MSLEALVFNSRSLPYIQLMIIATLFNSDAPKYHGYYGHPILSTILRTGVIQASQRHMKISVGDVLTYSHSKNWQEHDELADRAYFKSSWHLLFEKKLRATFRTATVYSVVFENMPEALAREMHRALLSDDSYLGMLAIDYTYAPHLVLFRNLMIPKFRVTGTSCNIFFSMNEEDDKDTADEELFTNNGYTSVNWEDYGARRTIFDNYDTLEHFKQVVAFRDLMGVYLAGGIDDAYELTMILEDLNPQLFNALGAGIQTLEKSTHEEHVAQAAISGRRYIQKLADALFPPQKALHKGRDVSATKYRSRIWAFVESNTNDPSELKSLGKELDRLDEEFNAGLHSDRDKERILRAYVDVAILTTKLLSLNPSATRNAYAAFSKQIVEFARDVAKQDSANS